jgi:hypothetical protein
MIEFYLAGGLRQDPEAPEPLQFAERAAFEADAHFLRKALAVPGAEMLFHLKVMDMDGGFGGFLIPQVQLGAATPGQKWG